MTQIASPQFVSPYRSTASPTTKPMAGAMGIVFVSLGLVMGLASRADAAGSTGLAIGIIAMIVVLFTLIDVEFGIYCLMAGMLLSPEIRLPWFQGLQRAVIIRIDDIMIILVGIVWFAQIAVRGKLDLLVNTPLNRPIMWFTFLTILSTARGAFMTGAVASPLLAFFFVLKFIEFFTLYFLIVNTVTQETQVKRIMTTYFFTLTVVALWAIYNTIITGESGRATTPFETEEEPGTLGGYLLFSFALAFGLSTYVSNFAERFLYFVLMAVIVPPFLYTLSRGSYMAFFPMFLTVLFLSKRKAVPVLLLIVVAAGMPFLPAVTVERVEYTFQNRLENIWSQDPEVKVEFDPSSAARLERYEGVIAQWMHQPLLGQGVTGVGFVDSQFFRVLGELGILGLLTLFWLFRNLFRTTIRLYRVLPIGYMKGLILGMIAGTVGLLFHGATANTFTVVRIAGPFWAMAALAIVISKIHQREMEEAA